MRYVFIPSRVSDNRILLDKDPGYVDRLYLSGSPELVKAWLFGDWNITVGAYFPEFGKDHIIAPIQLPDHWTRFRAIDWGSSRPFSVGWYAVSDGSISIFGKNTLIKYREWYGASAPNVGLKMTAAEVAQGIVARTPVPSRLSIPWPILQCSIRMAALLWQKSLLVTASLSDQQTNAASLAGTSCAPGSKEREGKPAILFFGTCPETIRTFRGCSMTPINPKMSIVMERTTRRMKQDTL